MLIKKRYFSEFMIEKLVFVFYRRINKAYNIKKIFLGKNNYGENH